MKLMSVNIIKTTNTHTLIGHKYKWRDFSPLQMWKQLLCHMVSWHDFVVISRIKTVS